jgi:hypothetical protein
MLGGGVDVATVDVNGRRAEKPLAVRLLIVDDEPDPNRFGHPGVGDELSKPGQVVRGVRTGLGVLQLDDHSLSIWSPAGSECTGRHPPTRPRHGT